MKKSEMLGKLIEIEKEKDTTITMNYVEYLKKLKRMVEIGDIEI